VVEIVDTEAKIMAFLPTLAVRLTVRHLFNQAREKIYGYHSAVRFHGAVGHAIRAGRGPSWSMPD
jgi:hypothetical protein